MTYCAFTPKVKRRFAQCVCASNLLVSLLMNSSCFPSSLATPSALTLEHHDPDSAGDVSNASLTCTAIAVYPVRNISWNVSGVLEHQPKNIKPQEVKQDKNSLLFNISSTAFFNCSDKSTPHIRCSLGNVTSDDKIVCEQPKCKCNLGIQADYCGRLSFFMVGVKKCTHVCQVFQSSEKIKYKLKGPVMSSRAFSNNK